jgi:hypothetical protein
MATGGHRNGQLAAAIGATPSQVGSDLRYLERMGLVDWRETEIRQFYCADCEEVVTKDNYDECEGSEIYPFMRIIRLWSLTAAGRDYLAGHGRGYRR